jgi:hypothetical protein
MVIELRSAAKSNEVRGHDRTTKEQGMKRIIAAGFCALAMFAGGANAQSANDSDQSQYSSQSAEGNSANWGVGG